MKRIIFTLCFIFFLFSCYSSAADQSKIWQMDIQLFESKLQLSDYQFLHTFNFEQLDKRGQLQEIYKLGNGSAYYFSFILGSIGLVEDQLRFLELEMREGRWKKEAVETIIELLEERELWNTLSNYLEMYIHEIDNDPEIQTSLLKALYKSKEFSKVLSYSDFTSYFSILSLIETKDSRWEIATGEYVYNSANNEEIYELYSLLIEKELFYDLDENLRLIILIFVSSFENDFQEAGQYLKNMKPENEIFNKYPSLFYKLRLIIERSGQAINWASYFQSIFSSLNNRSAFAATFNSGRLYVYAKDFENADRMFRLSIQNASTPFEEDRARWYLMNLYKNNLFFLTGLIEEFAQVWNDPYYFEDILSEYISLLSSKREWELLSRVFPIISINGDAETIAAFSWIKYLAVKSDIIGDGDLVVLIDNMLNSRHMGFYNLMGHLLTGNQLQLESSYNEYVYSDLDELILGYLNYNLIEEALRESSGQEQLLNDSVLRTLSQNAALNGNFLRSIQLINYVTSKRGYSYTLDDLKLMYPNEYFNNINYYSQEYGFSGEILSGIIRTESAFTSDIISYAGAVGLSQLMPETAEEHAGKLDLVNPDLTDPETNIHIGSSYIKWITDRSWSENMSEVLIAYNAGGGNLRKWKRLYPAFSDEFFAEVIPYKETRNYVKKVLTSSVLYGYLYRDLNPEDTVLKIYPDFNSLRSLNIK